MRCLALFFLSSLVAIAGLSCQGQKGAETTVSVTALTAGEGVGDVARVEVSLEDAAGIELTRFELTAVGTRWRGTGTLSSAPRGALRCSAVGFDAGGGEVGRVALDSVTVDAGEAAVVVLELGEHPARDDEVNEPPWFVGVAASRSVTTTASVSLVAATADGDDDEIELRWSASGGAVSETGAGQALWTPPAEDGAYVITARADDGVGGVVEARIRVERRADADDVLAEVVFNSWPQIREIAATSAVLNPGSGTTITVTPRDRDGDGVTLRWRDEGGECAGEFDETEGERVIWTAPEEPPASGHCRITAEASDGQGGVVTRDIEITVSPCAQPMFEEVAPLPAPRSRLGATPAVDGVIYVFGGDDSMVADLRVFDDRIWAYDTAEESYELLPQRLPYRMSFITAVMIARGGDGAFYISPTLGPEMNSGYGEHRCLVRFDPASGIAEETEHCFALLPDCGAGDPSCVGARWNARLAPTADGRVVAFGGWCCEPVDEIWVLDPIAGTFEDTGATIPVVGETAPTAALAGDGMIYVFGQGEVGRLDPSDWSFTTLEVTGMVSAQFSWISEAGEVCALGTAEGGLAWQAIYCFDPATEESRLEVLPAPVFGRSTKCQAFHAEERALYFFGGEVLSEGGAPAAVTDLVGRVRCLP